MARSRKGASEERAADGRRVYSLGDVELFVGVKRPQAQYWLKQQVIVPDYPATGTGNHQGFTFRNLIEFYIARTTLGLPLDYLKDALVSLREIDPDDWYTEMPRMRAAMDAADAAEPAAPTREESWEWIQAQLRKGGIGSGQFADAQWHLDAERHLPALGEPPELSPDYVANELRVLKKWRQFKNPATRKPGMSPIFCIDAGAAVIFSATELQRRISLSPTVTTVSLRMFFEGLERLTGDHWMNVGGVRQ